MPGSRTLVSPLDGKKWYYANNPSPTVPDGYGDEDAIRAIWASDQHPTRPPVTSPIKDTQPKSGASPETSAAKANKDTTPAEPTKEVTRDFLFDHIHGGWVGMLIGGLEGLPHEFKYEELPRETLPEFTFLEQGARTDDNDLEWTHIWFCLLYTS
ncbi:MAG: hypothetical protein N3G20_05360, partial [Verrucomicrobiae bacterium]|nr:hypothetical protein [Verrucomicrobiae bacterium]